MTYKVKVWIKGSLETSGTNGFGFITLSPHTMIQSDSSSVRASTAAFTSNYVNFADPGTQVFNSNSPYTLSDFALNTPGKLQQRVVSAGLRVRYIGTELNRGGQIVALHDPNHNTLAGMTLQDMNAMLESRKFPVNREWTTVLYKPVFPVEMTFTTAGYMNIYDFMGMTFQSPDPITPMVLEFEAFTVVEVTGAIAKGKTPSHSDPVGFSAIQSAALTSDHFNPTKTKSAQRESGFVDDVLETLASTASNVSFSDLVENLVKAGKIAKPLLQQVF